MTDMGALPFDVEAARRQMAAWRDAPRSFGERAKAGTRRVRVDHGFGDVPLQVAVTHRDGGTCEMYRIVNESQLSVSVVFPDQELMHDVSVTAAG